MKLLRFAALASLLILSSAGPALGQPPSVDALRKEITHLERVVASTNTPSAMTIPARRLLGIKREQLISSLGMQLNALRKYQDSYSARFSLRESRSVSAAISALEDELLQLKGSISSSSARSSVVERGHAEKPQRQFVAAADISSAANPNRAPLNRTYDRKPIPTRMEEEFLAPTTADASGKTQAAENSTTVLPVSVVGPLPQTQTVVSRTQPQVFTSANAPVTHATLDIPNAVIFNSRDAARIIKEARARGIVTIPTEYYDPASDTFSDDFHCVIHVLRWANPSQATDASGQQSDAQTVAAQNWYVFNNGRAKGVANRKWSGEDFSSMNRIFGVKRVWLLYIHLNRAANYGYEQARYDFNIQKKTAANIQNVVSLAQLFITLPAGAAGGPPPPPDNLWGGDDIRIDYVPSDITITASFVKTVDNGPVVPIDKPKKFDNEGRYWWDVSVAVPVRKISQTQFDTTANTVTAKEVDKQNVFALLNLYPVPVDIKGSNYSWIPHFVGGVAIAKQPLKKFLLGAGFGPHFANFYVGAVFTEEKKPATLKEGDAATPAQLNTDLRKSFKPKFSFGFNLPVRGVIESLKKQSK